MIEHVAENETRFKPQNRFEWYQMRSLLREVGTTVRELGIPPETIVHIGGSAQFHRCCQVFSNLAIPHFRGTHDIDVLCFSRGAMQRVLDFMCTRKNSLIEGYSFNNSTSLPDKKSLLVDLKKGMDPSLPTKVELDVFEPSNGNGIRYNGRVLHKDRIILDPPEILDLPNGQSAVAVPSLRDYFVFKMDVCDFSQSGLRPKDTHDIFVMLRMVHDLGVDFKTLCYALVEDCREQEKKIVGLKELSLGQQMSRMGSFYRSLQNKFRGLENIFERSPFMSQNAESSPIFPETHHVRNALDSVRRVKRESGPGNPYSYSLSPAHHI